MTLMEPLLNKGHCLTTDNFYSSPELADILIQSLTDMYGTLKPRRKDVPKELLSKKIDKGQMIAYHKESHKNEIRRKPKAVMEYNNTMGGVDRLDKHLTNYPLIKKGGGKKYYKNILSSIGHMFVHKFCVVQKKMVEKTLICSLEWTLLIA
ncbi:piggyBac transposable element-derived protein 4 [Trichonephila clavipes]|nr:piggyBac transposable element-derived protein 4 [Trichonephila clavipes]